MEELQRWWAGFINGVTDWLRQTWRSLRYGLQHEWDVGTFIFILAVVVILSAILLWRRRA